MGCSQPRRTLAAVILLCFFFHGWLLISDSVLWDGFTLQNAIQSGDYSMMEQQFRHSGAPHWAWMHHVLGQISGHVRVYKVLSLLCIVLSTAFIYLLAWQAPRWTAADAALTALVAAAYPFYSLWHELIMLPYAICYLCFFAGVWLYGWGMRQWVLAEKKPEFRISKSKTKPNHQNPSVRDQGPARSAVGSGGAASVVCVAFAVLLLSIAFTIESFGAYFYPVAGFLFVCAATAGDGEITRTQCWRLLRRHWPILLLPPAVFWGKRVVFPMTGAYREYNHIQLSLERVFRGFEDFFKRTVCDPVEDLIQFAVNDPNFFFLMLPCGVGVGLLAVFLLRSKPPQQSEEHLAVAPGLAIALLLFLAGSFPYVAVGKVPQLNTYECRHALLTALPIAIALTVFLHAVFRRPGSARIACGVLLALCWIAQAKSYVLWQNRHIKYLAVAENLEGQEAGVADVVVVDDRSHLGMAEKWRTYEINVLMKRAWGNERHVGFDAQRPVAKCLLEVGRQSPTRRKYLICRDAPWERILHENTPYTRIILKDNDNVCQWKTFTEYLLLSFSPVQKRRQWLKSLLQIRIKNSSQERISSGSFPISR